MGRTKKTTYADYEAAEQEVEEVEELQEELEESETEELAEETEEMTKSEARDYVEEQINNDFMEDVAPVKLTPAQRQKKIASLEEDIKAAQVRMAEIEPIAELADSTGFRTIVEEIKKQVHGKVDEEDIKTSKDGLKVLEAVLLTEKTVNGFKFGYNDRKTSIKNWENEIVELKAGQLTIFDGGKTDEEEVTEVNQIASNTSVDELAAVG